MKQGVAEREDKRTLERTNTHCRTAAKAQVRSQHQQHSSKTKHRYKGCVHNSMRCAARRTQSSARSRLRLLYGAYPPQRYFSLQYNSCPGDFLSQGSSCTHCNHSLFYVRQAGMELAMHAMPCHATPCIHPVLLYRIVSSSLLYLRRHGAQVDRADVVVERVSALPQQGVGVAAADVHPGVLPNIVNHNVSGRFFFQHERK